MCERCGYPDHFGEESPRTELDALLERVREVRQSGGGDINDWPRRDSSVVSGVAFDCLRMFEQVVTELQHLRLGTRKLRCAACERTIATIGLTVRPFVGYCEEHIPEHN